MKAPNASASAVFAIGTSKDDYYLSMTGNRSSSPAVAAAIEESRASLEPLDDATTFLVFQVKQGSLLQTFAVNYDPAQQRFWRFRHDQTATPTAPNGSIVFETSPDNVVYMEPFRAAVGAKTVSATACEISAGTATAVANPGQAVFDNFQLSVNDIDSSSFFVSQHYRDFLNRAPDIGGLQFWTNEVFSCGGDAKCIDSKRVNVNAAYFLSREFEKTGFYVIALQRAAFGRVSNDPQKRIAYQQFLADAKTVGAGFVDGQAGADAKLDQNKTLFAQSVANSAAFIQKYPSTLSAAQFVDALYQTAGVAPSAQERSDAIAAFGLGAAAGRAAALRRAAESKSVKDAEFRAAFVLLQYFGYLRRNPTDAPDNSDAGYQFWLNKLNQFNGDYIKSEMVRSFTVSQEYRKRFGTR